MDGFITMVVGDAEIDAARLLMQAIDPDMGGYNSFSPRTKDGLYFCSMPASEERMKLFEELMADAKKMQEFIARDLNTRFIVPEYLKESMEADPVRKKSLIKPVEAELTAMKDIAVISKEPIKDFETWVDIRITPTEEELAVKGK